MTFSIRCHAAVIAGAVHKNVVITYDGSHAPSPDATYDRVACESISISPFIAETHSTVDYNGVAVIGVSEISDIQLTLANLHDFVRRQASASASVDGSAGGMITFYKFG